MSACTAIFCRLLPLLVICGATVVRADQLTIVNDLKAFFVSDSPTQRLEIVHRIHADPDYSRDNVSQWLHQVGIYNPLEAGRQNLRVDVDTGSSMSVVLRVPAAYDTTQAYPLIYILHGKGGNADGIIRYVEHLLGEEVEQYVLAAPNAYKQSIIHSTTPPAPEHPAALLAVKRQVHIDSNRVYVMGYSRGGHTAWTLAVTHPDQFAGVIAVAGTLIMQDYGELYETFLPNIAPTRVFACWGANDVMSADYVTPSEDGGIAVLNRQLCKLAAGLELPLTWYEFPDQGHTGVVPPANDVDKILSYTRSPYPTRIRHVFRTLHQSRTAWIEAHDWRGTWWDQKPLQLKFRAGEDGGDHGVQRAARARAIRGRLGELRGEVDGQTIKVYRKKITELTVWIGDGMIDWEEPVALTVNGRKSFTGKLQPDLYVCLSQAARTYDFDRLRWAGLRFKSGSKTKIVNHQTAFPELPSMPD